MKKKIYIQPCMDVMQAQVTKMLADSVMGSYDIGYGGTDVDGSLDPSTRECDWNMWEEE